ncbi:MAG: hypothetical protein CSA84_06965 [Actinomycetales bacterium]|nr:MAG: hypothetical protein CSA84_06965 [Actinomycetales bacterium]
MTNVLHLLDDIPPYSDTDRFNDWMSTVGESLAHHQQEWLSAVARVEQLSKDHGWILLSWIEESANQIVRTPAPDFLITCVFAMSLALKSDLDPRDCLVVAALLRRACVLTGLDYTAGVIQGCEQAGSPGQEAKTLLLHASPDLPRTHAESGSGKTFTFTRVDSGFDASELERW